MEGERGIKKDSKELRRIKKEKKERKTEQLLKRLEQHNKGLLQAEAAALAAKPVPKNIVQELGEATKGRHYTVSIAVPGSVLDNAQTGELRTYLAGQIARAAAIFSVDEIIVFDDGSNQWEQSCGQLARILQYLECPQYLRKHFFPLHADLQYAGVLNPTDMPHHLRASELSLYREGVVTERPAKENCCFVNIGLKPDCLVKRYIKPGLRVTVRLNDGFEWSESRKLSGTVVSPSEPRTKAGLYWGYTVRGAKDLSEVFTGSPYKDGYDLTIGTSEKGGDVDSAELTKFKHLLVVFGGVGGLEAALQSDEALTASDPSQLFDQYLNTCPNQGSRTIRSEEAILVTMAALRPKIQANIE